LIEILKIEQHMGAAEALGKLGDARSVEPLISLLKDKSASEWLRYACAKALGKIGDRRALPILSEVAHDEGDKARYSAAEALGGMGPAAIPDLVAALRSQDWAVRRKAGDALNRLGVPSDPLTQAHYAAAQGLWERAIPLGETAVEPFLYVVDGDNFEKVVNALCRIGALGVEALLSGLTGAEGWMSRKAAARALGTIRDQRAVGALKAALADKEERVRDEAQQALTKIT
jgi:HEAT repeat protein